MNGSFFINFQSENIIFYLIIGIISIGVSWWSYSGFISYISTFKKYLLVSLRSLGIFLIGILLLEPLLTTFSEKVTGTGLGVIVDISSSMNIEDENGLRYITAKTAFDENRSPDIECRYYGFSDTLIELKNYPDSSMVAGKGTDIADAVLSSIASSDELGALLVITDGARNIGIDPLKAVSAVDLPVYSLVTGGGISRKDVFISHIDYPLVGYTSTEFQVEIEIGAAGYQGTQSTVEIRQGKNVMGSQRISLPADGAHTSAEFKFSVTDDGVKDFKAYISKLDDEIVDDNNIRNFRIKFLKDKIKILLLSSSLNWEFTYLKKALKRDQHFDLATAIAHQRGRFSTNDLPANLDSWKDIELVIGLDISARSLGVQLSNFKAAVEAGTGYLYLAGDKSKTYLKNWMDILPVKAGLPLNILQGEFFPVPGKHPRVQAIMDIDGLKWEELPPLKVLLTGFELNDNAFVFLDASDEMGKRQPVFIGGRLKRGKTAVITGFPWWHRYFRQSADASDISRIEKFWANIVRWLVVREDLERFNIAPDKAVFKLGEPVGFTATFFDDNYNLVSGARIDVVIADSAGIKRELQLSGKKPGQYAGDFGSPAAGLYGFNASAVVAGDTVATSSGNFIVETFSLEMENPSANYAMMEQVAALTGGKSYTPDNFAQFADDLQLKIKRSDVFTEYRLTGNTYMLGLIIFLFALEWGIRKFSQLA